MFTKMILILAFPLTAFACLEHTSVESMHQMQHGFILSDKDQHASHLVASGHHSRQTEIAGTLVIDDSTEAELYNQRKALNSDGGVYFLFQAQQLDLPSLQKGQILLGHIVESRVGQYDSKNIIIKAAKFKVEKVILNIENPFFGE